MVEQMGNRFGGVGEKMQVDVRTLPNVAGQHASDEPGPKGGQQPHQTQRRNPHGL